ncbi:hypothetical protein AB0A74_30535 [Saccharothrix sp. NPDC042600]|uniref:hypothetical protein n=1 Tax=Saccharothrix TaxID=2071 RepID=UPI0033EA4EEB
MHHTTADENLRLHFWTRVREFAVPPSMVETATARRSVGDWAGACAAARFDVDLDLRAVGRTHGRQLAAQVRADLRHLAPDLLRWHFPRIGPDGLLRPGLTVSLARYAAGPHLVARTPPAWAAAGQRISLAWWDPAEPRAGAGTHPHPRPDRRFRLDLHRHLWDARRAGELRERSAGGDPPPGLTTALRAAGSRAVGSPAAEGPAASWAVGPPPAEGPAAPWAVEGEGFAVGRWVPEALLLLRADRCADRVITVRLNAGRWLALAPDEPTPVLTAAPRRDPTRPVLPDAATRTPPDLDLLRAGLVDADRLHPLVASALVPGHRRTTGSPDPATGPRLVECRGATHRIGVVDGVLVPLDHDPDEVRREELLAEWGGPPLPCLRAIDDVHRQPESLVDVRARLDHGDTAGAVAAVEALLGPEALLRAGALRDELDAAVRRRLAHGLYRAGLAGGPAPSTKDGRRRVRPRHAFSR